MRKRFHISKYGSKIDLTIDNAVNSVIAVCILLSNNN